VKPALPLLVACFLLASVLAPHAFGQSAGAAEDGKAIFEARCAACHQPNGEGISGTFPPLAKNKDVTAKDPTRIIGIVLHGLNTPLTVNGKTYPGGMPLWKGALSNAEIAAVLTYIRNSWGNKASPVTEKQVAAVK
jgi:mono/diheme cytochrome c family protein